MIIRCEQCDTRFQLDDSRIPEQGARVRCSLCKHAFFVQRPDASASDAVDAVAAAAVESEAASVPEPAWDLDGASDAAARSGSGRSEGADVAEDSDAAAGLSFREGSAEAAGSTGSGAAAEPAAEAPGSPAEPPPPAEAAGSRSSESRSSESRSSESRSSESDWEFESPVPGGPTAEAVEAAAPQEGPAAPDSETCEESPVAEEETAVFPSSLEQGLFADEEPSVAPVPAGPPDETDASFSLGSGEGVDAAAGPAGPEVQPEPRSAPEVDPGATELETDAGATELETDPGGSELETEDESSLGELGDPSTWDLESELEAAGVLGSADEGWTWDAEAGSEASAAPHDETRSERDGGLELLPPERRAQPVPVAQITGWMAVCALIGLGLWALVHAPTPLEAAPRPPLPALTAGGLEVAVLQVRPVENVNAGTLWVVSGQIRNPGSRELRLRGSLRVRVTDSAGAPLTEVPAVAALGAQVIREAAPDALRAGSPASGLELAGTRIAPGGSTTFDAVLPSLPAEAAGLSIVPGPEWGAEPDPPTGGGGEAESDGAAGGAAEPVVEGPG